jgi:hypothetical protein
VESSRPAREESRERDDIDLGAFGADAGLAFPLLVAEEAGKSTNSRGDWRSDSNTQRLVEDEEKGSLTFLRLSYQKSKSVGGEMTPSG